MRADRICGLCGRPVKHGDGRKYSDRGPPFAKGWFHIPCSPDGVIELALAIVESNEDWWIERHERAGLIFDPEQKRAILSAARGWGRRAAGVPHGRFFDESTRVKPSEPHPASKPAQRSVPVPVPKTRAGAPRGTAFPKGPTGKSSYAVVALGQTFRVRWLKHKPFLFRIEYGGCLRHSRPKKKATYMGRVPEDAAAAGPAAVAGLIRRGKIRPRGPLPPRDDD